MLTGHERSAGYETLSSYERLLAPRSKGRWLPRRCTRRGSSGEKVSVYERVLGYERVSGYKRYAGMRGSVGMTTLLV